MTALDAVELSQQLVLDGRRTRQLFRERLHLARPLGDLCHRALARGDELDEPPLLLGDGRLVDSDAVDSAVRGLDFGLDRVELLDERNQAVLKRADRVELELHVRHLFAEAVAGGLERLELHSARELLLELAIDVRARCIEAVQASFELLDERHAGAHARNLRIELGDRFVEARRFLSALLDGRHFGEDGVHLGFELRSARRERRHAFTERFEPEPVGAQLVAELRDVGVRLVEFLHFFAKHVEIQTALPERVHLPRRFLGELVDQPQLLVQGLERQLLFRQLV